MDGDRLRKSHDDLKAALEALFALHEPEGRFQPSHYKPILAQVKKALDNAAKLKQTQGVK